MQGPATAVHRAASFAKGACAHILSYMGFDAPFHLFSHHFLAHPVSFLFINSDIPEILKPILRIPCIGARHKAYPSLKRKKAADSGLHSGSLLLHRRAGRVLVLLTSYVVHIIIIMFLFYKVLFHRFGVHFHIFMGENVSVKGQVEKKRIKMVNTCQCWARVTDEKGRLEKFICKSPFTMGADAVKLPARTTLCSRVDPLSCKPHQKSTMSREL